MNHPIVCISLLAMLLAGCAGNSDVSLVDVEKQAFDDLRSEIRITIDDTGRETRAIELVDELAKELESLRQLKAERQDQGRRLNAKYDTTRAEFDAFISETSAKIRLNQQRILNLRGAFIATTTAEEWDQIFDARTDAISAAIKSTHSI